MKSRKNYYQWISMSTRWADSDIFGHINNVKYYEYFDTAANQLLINEANFDPINAKIVGYVVHSECNYHQPILHPSDIEVGFSVNKLGTSSVQYSLAVFVTGHEQAAATGTMTHVFVDRDNEKSTAIPSNIRAVLKRALREI